MSNTDVEHKSTMIINKIYEMIEYKKAQTVMLYYPIRNEVNIKPLIRKATINKRICLPYVEKGIAEMTAREVEGIKYLKKDKFGIKSPDEYAKVIDPNDIDFIVVPMIAFDKNKHRVGYGGGYYDKFLRKCTNAMKCGIAFSFQEVEYINNNEFDIKLDIILSEYSH